MSCCRAVDATEGPDEEHDNKIREWNEPQKESPENEAQGPTNFQSSLSKGGD
jgi:hypothetical protein